MSKVQSSALSLLMGVMLMGCQKDNWGPEKLALGESNPQQELVERGRQNYQTFCVGCHGENGDGNGPAATFLNPKPRDFRKGRVKFATVPAGTMPRDEDILRTLDHGLDGTSMPKWNLIPKEDKLAIVAYIKTFSEIWHKESPGAVVSIKPDPFRKKPARGVTEGERVYHGFAACYNCHPAYVAKEKIVEHLKSFETPFAGFREGLYQSVEKESDWGAPIKPPDFLKDKTKSARTKEELVVVIATGVGGTAMPSWGATLTNEQLWGLAYYVESVIQKRDTAEGRALIEELSAQANVQIPVAPTPAPTPTPTVEPSAAPSASASAAPANSGTK